MKCKTFLYTVSNMNVFHPKRMSFHITIMFLQNKEQPHTKAARQPWNHEKHSNNLHFWRTCQQSKHPSQTCNLLQVLQVELCANLIEYKLGLNIFKLLMEIFRSHDVKTHTHTHLLVLMNLERKIMTLG